MTEPSPHTYAQLTNAQLGAAFRQVKDQGTADLAPVRLEITRRGFILHARDTAVGELVRGNDRDGTIYELHPDGMITVDWGAELTRGCPGSRFTQYHVSALETGNLRRRQPAPE